MSCEELALGDGLLIERNSDIENENFPDREAERNKERDRKMKIADLRLLPLCFCVVELDLSDGLCLHLIRISALKIFNELTIGFCSKISTKSKFFNLFLNSLYF